MKRVKTARWLALGTAMVLAVVGFGVRPAYAAVSFSGHFTFVKNTSDPTNSRLYFNVQRSDLDPPRTVLNTSWRAGSGDGSENPCYRNHGWLPNGTYSVYAWKNHQGTITGHAFQLNNTHCSDGTPRTDLFVHTSFPWSTSRYHSEGCIKLSNADINTAYNDFTSYFAINHTYSGMLTVQ
jgi:lipoprotein-anchoring transpeptidase ErfK/SrfK